MLEAQNMSSVFEVPPGERNKKIFKEFIKFLYFDDMQIQNEQKLGVEEVLYVCEICDFSKILQIEKIDLSYWTPFTTRRTGEPTHVCSKIGLSGGGG